MASLKQVYFGNDPAPAFEYDGAGPAIQILDPDTGDVVDLVPARITVGAATVVVGARTVRAAAGVPSGAPTGTELPIAFDSTAVSGGVYYWTGAAWVKGASI